MPTQVRKINETLETSEHSMDGIEPETNIDSEVPDNVSIPSIVIDDAPNPSTSSHSLIQALNGMEATFCLKQTSKNMLSTNVMDDIMNFSEKVHAAKLEIVINELKKDYCDAGIDIEKITNDIEFMDNCLGLKDQLSTNFKREKYLKERFDFIEPEPIEIKSEDENVTSTSFYYQISPQKSLERLMKDPTLRRFLIHEPPVFEVILSNFISLHCFLLNVNSAGMIQ